VPLKDFDVTLAPDQPARLLATRPEAAEAARWMLADVPVRPGWLAAVAVAAGEPLRLVVIDAHSDRHLYWGATFNERSRTECQPIPHRS
jgi:hypothetical protein